MSARQPNSTRLSSPGLNRTLSGMHISLTQLWFFLGTRTTMPSRVRHRQGHRSCSAVRRTLGVSDVGGEIAKCRGKLVTELALSAFFATGTVQLSPGVTRLCENAKQRHLGWTTQPLASLHFQTAYTGPHSSLGIWRARGSAALTLL